MFHRLIQTLCLGAILALANSAQASVKFCLKYRVTYRDNGNGEDYWQGDNDRHARGMRVTVLKDGKVLFRDYLGDGLGSGDPGLACTKRMYPDSDNGRYAVYAYSWGRVNGHSIDVRNDNSTRNASTLAFVNHTRGSGTHDVLLNIPAGNTDAMFRVYQTAAYALYRHWLGIPHHTFKFSVGGGTSYSEPESQINVSLSTTERKFKTIHEMGHAVADYVTDGRANDINGRMSQDFPECPAPSYRGGGSHSMTSKEFVGTAVHEGFAHFYAADTWNNDDHTSCSFSYWKRASGLGTSVIDCEASSDTYPTRYLETQCDGGAGRGNELDWLRAFWDVHTDRSDSPSTVEMLRWYSQASEHDDWTSSRAFWAFDSAANSVGGRLNSNWDTSKTRNGIDH